MLISIIFLPFLLGFRKMIVWGMKIWSRVCVWLMKYILKLDIEVKGIENLNNGPFLIASKHQSMFETIVLPGIIDDPAVILKKELSYIPLYGWHALKLQNIFINRKKGLAAISQMFKKAQKLMNKGRNILIFPEGTRTLIGEKVVYNPGIAALYTRLKFPCVPVALNSGLFWPRRKFNKYPGKVTIEFLKPIPPGLPRKSFMSILKTQIEETTERLIKEAKKEL